MSAEFEKIVLEKLNILDELKAEIKNLSKKVDNLEEKVESNTDLINNVSTALSEKIDVNTDLIAILSKQVDQQGLNFAKFEHECMLKLNALFDSFVANSESHAVFSKFIAQLNAESFDYRQRISKLEEYFRSSKILATN